MAPCPTARCADRTSETPRRPLRLPIVLTAFVVVAVMVFSPAQGSLLGTAAAALPSASAAPPSLGGWVDVPGTSIPAGVALGAPLAATANVAGSLSFSETDPAGAQNVATAVNDPASPFFQHYLQGDQFDAAFGPNPSQQHALLTYLDSHDVVVSVVSVFLWNVRGTASAMDAAFGTTFVTATSSSGHVGWAPATPIRLPSDLASGVQAVGAFQNAQPAYHTDNLVPKMLAERAAAARDPAPQSRAPHATITLNVTNPFIIYPSTSGGNESFDYAPTGMNETYTLTITGGTAPYTVTWWWGDGSEQSMVTSATTVSAFHNYPFPGQTDYCDANFLWSCLNQTVTVTDSLANVGTFLLPIVPVTSPRTDELFYNALPLYRLGDTGQGVKIGLGEMCDPGYPTANYMTDINYFSTVFGLPLLTASTLQLVGSGNSDTSCANNGGGAPGWAGETLLDMEWSHSMAPNATLVVDLAASLPQEGDLAWDNLANGVFLSSNSWGCSYNSTAQNGCGPYFAAWNQAAAQGETYLTASGDCGAVMFGYNPPADSASGLGIGGTDIYPFSSGIFRTEFAWNGSVYDPNGCANDEGSTGGYASNYAQYNVSGVPTPWYQVGMLGYGNNIWRGVPDVSAIGGTWVEQYQGIYGGWFPDAGTSLASPTTVGMLALIYDYNGTASKPNGLANNDLYEIANGANYGIGIHDITVGNNIVWSTPLDYSTDNFGPCAACYNNTAGWNPVNGLGSFDVSNLAELMANQSGNGQWLSPLTAYLATNVTDIPVGSSVNFGVDVAGGTPKLAGYTYLWQFGSQGATAMTSQPWDSFTYTCAGNYPATVVVSAPTIGGVVSNTVNIHVNGTNTCGTSVPLQAVASATPTFGAVPLSVGFTGSASGGTPAYTYSWNFGDGSPVSSTQNPTHTYTFIPSSGTFDVDLSVTDSMGHTVISSVMIHVSTPVIATASANPTSGSASLTVDFTGAGAGGSAPYTWYWNFGDGTTGSALQDPAHTYTAAGGYKAILTVNDTNGLSNSSSVWITVSTAVVPLSIAITPSASWTVGQAGTFSSTVSGGTTPYAYGWSFGDSGTSTLADPSHTYASAGTFPIELTVTDSSSPMLTGHAFTNVTVSSSSVEPLSCSIGAPSSWVVGTAGQLSGTCTGGTSPDTWAWTFGDGGTATVQDPSHAYASAGKFPIELTVTDSSSPTLVAHAFTNATVAAAPAPLHATITAGPTSATVGEVVDYWATASGGSGTYSTYTFTCGGCSATQTPIGNWTEYKFSSAGTYYVKVTITDSAGNTNTSSAVVVSVTSGSTSSPGGSGSTSPLSGDLLYVLVAAVIIAVAVVALLFMRRKKPSSTPPAPWSSGAAAGATAGPTPPGEEPPPSSDD
jgi:subtilase family serine protease